MRVFTVCLTFYLALLFGSAAAAGDWSQWGGSSLRNNAIAAGHLPVEWNAGAFDSDTGRWLPETAKNVRWVARLGTTSYGTPVVAQGRVFAATNNGAGWRRAYPSSIDLGCLLCFRQHTGEFLWQLSCEKLAEGRAVDYPEQGICCNPLVEGNRAWIVTNRCEVVCLDTEGLEREAKIVWRYNMFERLRVRPHHMAASSLTCFGEMLLLNTSNGVDENHKDVPSPDAPSFIALDKSSGRLLWSDKSPGKNIMDGQWSSPAVGILAGVPQAIFAGGDGWLYSFRLPSGPNKKFELLWCFDCNPKNSAWKTDGSGDRGNLIATPVIHGGRVYIATGQDPEYGEGPGRLWCIDPGRLGDVSPELVVDRSGQVVTPRRNRTLDASAGESLRANPHSAALWHYVGYDGNADGALDFQETMHRTLSTAAIHNNLLVVPDVAGIVHCLDARTGKVYWTYDAMSQIWGSPCLADGKIYVGDQDGDVLVFALEPKLRLLAKNAMQQSVYSTPVAVDDTLYIATLRNLFALRLEEPGRAKPSPQARN